MKCVSFPRIVLNWEIISYSDHLCKRTVIIYILSLALQLLKELKKVNFELDNQNFLFDEHGDFISGYDLIMWERDGHHRRLKKIGNYNVLDEQIGLVGENFTWLSTTNATVRQHHTHGECSYHLCPLKDSI